MKSILEIYSKLFKDANSSRFLRETFIDLVYKDASPKLTVVDIGAYAGDFSFFHIVECQHA